MKVLDGTLGGAPYRVHFPEHREEIAGFEDFLRKGDRVLGFDTESTGLDLFARSHRLRLAQFGNTEEAWVLRVDLFRADIARALRQDRHFVAHNATFDLLAVDRHLGVTLESLSSRVFDTRILGHLLDPRTKAERGTGLRLKDLAGVYVADDAPDVERDLHAIFRSEYGATKATGWALIDVDHDVFVRYAGLDPILAARLFREIAPLVRDLGLDHLSRFEHLLASRLAILERRGLLVDEPYTVALRERLAQEAEHFRGVARGYGVENVNSTKQVSEALVAMGETLTETTDSGALAVSKDVLLPIADLSPQWERLDVRTPNPLADAIVRAKRAEKWGGTYIEAFLEGRDSEGRIHPSIGGLQARTARMSVSRPPLQQLPSGDWTVRRAIVADPGRLIVAADYSQVEMRVLAALADEPVMKEAISSGVDLHDFTAARVFGPDFTKAERKVAKAIGFGKVYGGGLATIVRQTGADPDKVREALRAYDETFPGIKRYAKRLQSRAEYGKREVVTPSGRHLPLDRDRLYAATNYVVQSTARDLLAQAIVDLFDAGLGEFLLLPIHDEILADAPAGEAEEIVREIGRTMESNFYGVEIKSDAEVYGPSWGHGYGAEA